MIFHTKCDLLGKEVLALFKRVYEADTEIENMKAGGSDASVVSQDHRRTQLGCLDCFASIVLLKLRRPHDTSVVDLGTFPFQDIPKHLVSLPREHAGDPSALTKGLGIGSAFDLQTYTFLANALITACPRVGQAGVEAEYAASVLPGIIKRMAFRDKASYAAERSRQEVLSDEILLQIVFVSAYHLPSRVVARYGADLLAMVATSVTRGLPGPVLTAAARVAACLLTKDDLDLGADSAGALGDLERAMRRALGEEDASDELKTICQAVISALSART